LPRNNALAAIQRNSHFQTHDVIICDWKIMHWYEYKFRS